MDARDRLRRYLEQRRELGESEYVLDGLSVETVMEIVGARPANPRRGAASTARAGHVREDMGASPSPGAPPADGRMDGAVANSDAGHDADHIDAGSSAPPQDFAPPLPAPRFDDASSTDWRAALRGLEPSPPRQGSGTAGSSVGTHGTTPPTASASAAPGAAGSEAAASASRASASMLPAWLEALDIPAGLDAGNTQTGQMAPDIATLPSLDAIARHVATCQRCTLSQSAKNPVPGEGNPHADFLCVGEAPGANEDAQGRPFVGEAGQLLTKILGAIQLPRESVWICNVLKHRPPGNRDPQPDEVQACQPYLLRQIELVRPKVILALGRFAAQTLLQTTTSIGALRGKIHRYHGVPLIVTYHPAALLRNESWKRPTWEDVKLARRILDAAMAADGGASKDVSAGESH